LTNTKYPPTVKVDLYTDKAPVREYKEIGRIIASEDSFTGEKNMIRWAIKKAKKIGADGLIRSGEDRKLWAVPSAIPGSLMAGDAKQIVFIAIKYKD
jgi:hypothetical protein